MRRLFVFLGLFLLVMFVFKTPSVKADGTTPAIATDSVAGYLSAADHVKITAAVANSTTVNGHALTSNVTVVSADLNGRSNSTGYWLCTTANCSSTAQGNFVGGVLQ